MAESRHIYLYDEFNSPSAKMVVEALYTYDKEDREKMEKLKDPEILPIHLHINSYGGEAASLRAILSAMDAVLAPIVTVVEGAAYSCGSLLSVCGDYRIIGEHADLLIHPPFGGTRGEASDMKADADHLQWLDEWCVNLYAKHSNIDKEELEEAFAKHKQWYIPAEEALALGLVDAIAPTKESEYNKKKKTFSMKLDGLSYESTFA